MKGNSRQSQKENIENKIIKRIDKRIKPPRRAYSLLKVPILELLAYKAAITGRAVGA